MASHFDFDPKVFLPASQRYLERTPTREENRRRIRSGLSIAADSPERVQLRMERLYRAAAHESGRAAQHRARAGNAPLPPLVEAIGFERVIGKPDFQGMDFLAEGVS